MKRILLLSLLLLPIVALAQYPTFSNKQKLGVQTTGDGLIYRGGIHPNYYTPSNINNAYFYLDTTTSKLYLYSATTWQQVYPTASDTISLGAYLLKSDTLSMLLPYLRKSDTISLSNRINNKLSLADTASMLLPYLKLADTTSMLTPYFRDSDTTMLNLITRFNSKLNTTDTVSLSNRIDLKLNKTDTINLSNRIDLKLNKSDTISLSNRIDIKLNASDTVSLSNRINTKLNSNDTINLSNRINKKLDTLYVNYQTNVDLLTNKDTINITTLEAGAGINITNNVISLDTTLLDSVVRIQNIYVKNDENTTLLKGEAVYVTGANGTNILVKRASNIAESSSSKTLGLTMTSIPSKGFGYVIKEGLLKGLNTNSANAGDPIWLGVNGALIYGLTNKPYAPNHLVYLGVVTDKQQNNGEVYVTVQNGFEIKELHDVQILSPENKASLYYNSSQSLWRDTTAALLVSDTASMLSKYVNIYSNQTGINGDKTFNNVVTIDSATVTGKLLVNTNISDAVKISSNTNSTNLELMNSSGTVSIKSSNKNMILQTDTTALVYLNGNNKKVGILTMNPQQELEVAGNVRIDSLNNNIVPTRMVGSDNNGDLTNVNLGEGLSFVNDTLKVDLTIIDTAIAASSITLAGHVTGTGSTNSTVNTTISNNVVTNDMLTGGISDTKLNTITTTGKVDNSATTATSSNIANTIVLRDNNRDFTARNITATNFYGLASTATLANTIQSSNTTGIIKLTTSSNSVLPIITVPDVNAAMATTNLSQTFGGTQTFSNTISGSINGNAATVTSVLPSNFASQTANTVLAAPNGSSGTPTFRLLTSTDIPSLNYLPLTGGTTSGLITSSFTNITNYSTSATDNNAFTIYNNTTSSNNIYGGLQFLIGQNSGAIPGGPGLAQIYAIRAGSASNPSTDLTFSTKSNVSGVLEKMRIKFDGKVGIGTTAPSYLLDVNGQIGSTGFIKSGGLSTQFLKADGSVDANTYLTSGTAAYLPLAGGTLSGNLYGINQGLSTNLTISDIIPENSSPLFTTITTGPSSSETVRFGLNQSLSGGANMFMGGTQGLGGNPTNPNIFFTDSRKAYASIGGIHTSSGTNNQSGHIVFSTTPSVNTIALTERMRIAQDGAITMGGTLGVTGATNFKDLGNHTFVNYIQNGDFDLTSTIDASAFNYGYPHYIPLFWKSAATSRYVSRWSTTGGYNSSGVYQQYDGDSSTGGALYQDVVNWESLKGKTVTACGWFTKGSLVNTGNHAEIQIDDGVTTKSVGSIGTTTTWQRACVTKTISASATRVRVIVGCDLGHSNQGGAASDIDAISLVVGDGKHQFTPKPIFDSGNQRLAGSLTLGYDNEDNIAYNPAGTSTLKVASLSGTGTRMVVANNTGVLSTQAIPTGTLVGTDTVNLSNRINTKVGLTGNETINGTKTFGGLIVPTNGMQLTATGNNSNKLLGLNVSNIVGEITLGSGLSLSNNILSVTTTSGGFVTTNSNYTVTITDAWIVFNNNFSNITVTLPNAATSTGRTLYFRNAAAGSIVSAGTANIIDNTVTTGTPNNNILGAGNTNVKWCTLVSNGTYWIKMQAGSL